MEKLDSFVKILVHWIIPFGLYMQSKLDDGRMDSKADLYKINP